MRRADRAVLRVALLAAALPLAGCEWFATMGDPVDIQPHEREPWPPPAGSIPLGGDPTYTLADVDGLGLVNPVPDDSASVAAGAAYYATFCSVCHGAEGMGDGALREKFPAIPPVATAQVAGYTDAYLYALVTQGRGLMPEYSRIPRAARWSVVRFLRTLETGAPAGPGAAPAGAAPAPAAPAGSGS